MQMEAVEYTEGPLLILAGAGSGKTRVLTHRIASLIRDKGVNPWNIMAITFTNKAAGEMRERVDKIVGYGSERIWVSTFHSSCVRILRRHAERLGYANNFAIYDTDDQKSLIKDIMKRLQMDPKLYRDRAIMAAISSAKDEMIEPDQYRIDAGIDWKLQKYAAVYAEYQAELKKNNAMDFDDLLVQTVKLFQQFPEVLDYYQEQFRYIMVDEYQDTNTVQFRFVSLLAAKYRNLCVVGDDDQSIYKFRGANIENILSFEHVFPDAKVIKLEQNYRSTQNILNAANEVIANNQGRKAKRLWTENPEGDLIDLRQFQSGFEEAEYVAGEITRGVRTEGKKYRDYAILYRTNAQSRLFEEKLLLANVPYKIVGGVNFYARREIKDLLAYLRVIENPEDDLAVLRIINVPRRGIGAATINKVQDWEAEQGIRFYDALLEAEYVPGLMRSLNKIKSFTSFLQVLRAKADYLSVKELLNEIIEETGYVADLLDEAAQILVCHLSRDEGVIQHAAIDGHGSVQRVEAGADFHLFDLVHSLAVAVQHAAQLQRGTTIGVVILDAEVLGLLGVDKRSGKGVLLGDDGVVVLKAVVSQHLLHLGVRARGDLIDHAPGERDLGLVLHISQELSGDQALLCPLGSVSQNRTLDLIAVVRAVVHALHGQGQFACLEALVQQSGDLAHGQHGGQATLQVSGSNAVAFLGDGERDHLQAGVLEDLHQTCPVSAERVIGFQALGDGSDDFLLDVAGRLQADQQAEVIIGLVSLVDDLVVKALGHDDAAVILAAVQSLVEDGSRESAEDVAGTKVHPGGFCMGLGLDSLDIKLGQLVAFFRPLSGQIAVLNIRQLHCNQPFFFSSSRRSSRSQTPSMYWMPRARSYLP